MNYKVQDKSRALKTNKSSPGRTDAKCTEKIWIIKIPNKNCG